jgi:hypothetical protein
MTKEDAVKAAAFGIPVQRTDPTTGKITVYKRISAVIWRYATLDGTFDEKRVDVELQAANGARSVSIVPAEQVEAENPEHWEVQRTIAVRAEEPEPAKAAKKTVFRRPSVGEVAAFALENLIQIDAQAFVDHYDACGWVVGRNKPMKDWKAAVRNWNRRQSSFPDSGKAAAPAAGGSFDTDDFFRNALSKSYSDDVNAGIDL